MATLFLKKAPRNFLIKVIVVLENFRNKTLLDFTSDLKVVSLSLGIPNLQGSPLTNTKAVGL